MAKVRGKVLAVLDRGVIGSDDPKLAEAFLRAVRELLREGVADFTHFSSVPLNSPVRPAAQAIFPWYMREGNNIIEPRWYLNIPANFNEFIASRSKNTRANLRRNEKARQASGIGFRVELYTGDGGALVRAYDTVQEVARCTYQYRLGLSPLCEPLSREVWESLSTVGKVAAAVVFAEGQPISFAYAQLYKGTAKFGTLGYKPNFGPLRVGEYAILRLIETLIDCEIRVLDYGLGYSQYKETLGTDFRMEGHVRVFAGSARGLFIRLLRTTTVCASRFLLAGAERLKVKRLIKKLVRSHS